MSPLFPFLTNIVVLGEGGRRSVLRGRRRVLMKSDESIETNMAYCVNNKVIRVLCVPTGRNLRMYKPTNSYTTKNDSVSNTKSCSEMMRSR
jgi:hypothetical protein